MRAPYLSYTDVVAPIAGRTGIRLIDEGNLVKASDTTGIVVITQLQPISVFFSLPQQVLPELNRGLAEGVLPVEALGADGKAVLDRGKVRGDRQPGRSDDRHGQDQGGVSQRPICSSGRGNSSTSSC